MSSVLNDYGNIEAGSPLQKKIDSLAREFVEKIGREVLDDYDLRNVTVLNAYITFTVHTDLIEYRLRRQLKQKRERGR